MPSRGIVHPNLSGSTKLTGESLGETVAVLNRLGERKVTVGLWHILRSEGVITDALATTMKRLTDEYEIMHCLRSMINEFYGVWLRERNAPDSYSLWPTRVLFQHYGVGPMQGDPGDMAYPGAVAFCDLGQVADDPNFSEADRERLIRRFQKRETHAAGYLDLLHSLCDWHKTHWGLGERFELLCPIYIPESLSGVHQLSPKLTIINPEYFDFATPRLTID